MNIQAITLQEQELQKLFLSGNAHAVLLHLYLRAGNPMDRAQQELNLSAGQFTSAGAALRQLGLLQEIKTTYMPGERPSYSEKDVTCALDSDTDFQALQGELQRMLGKPLTTEELKILLGFSRYLGLPNEVITVLVCYCRERASRRGNLRAPSLRSIEKEAYAWAEQGIDSLEAAAAYIRTQNNRDSYVERLKRVLQIHGRNLTAGEVRYAAAWLEMGFGEDVLSMAYERTCLNTGGLSWAYMNRILTRWHEAGLHTPEQIKNGDRKPSVPKGASGELGQAELEAIYQVMQEG